MLGLALMAAAEPLESQEPISARVAAHAVAGRSRRQREDDLFLQMWFLREHGTLVGEMATWPGGLRLFVYAWQPSPHHDELVARLTQRVDVPAAAIDYDGWPR